MSYRTTPDGFYWVMMDRSREGAFEAFVVTHEHRLRTALVLTYGPDHGREATAEALAYAWEHWDRVQGLDAPVAYLYRVGQSRTRRSRRRTPTTGFGDLTRGRVPWVEPALGGALDGLSSQQRVCVVLIHSYEWTFAEVAEVLGVSRSTVQAHVERGLARLRDVLEVELDG